MSGIFNASVFNNSIFNVGDVATPSGGYPPRERKFVDYGTQYERRRVVADKKAAEVVEKVLVSNPSAEDFEQVQSRFLQELEISGILAQAQYMRQLNALMQTRIERRIAERAAEQTLLLILMAASL